LRNGEAGGEAGGGEAGEQRGGGRGEGEACHWQSLSLAVLRGQTPGRGGSVAHSRRRRSRMRDLAALRQVAAALAL
jgi:hypothetical protein